MNKNIAAIIFVASGIGLGGVAFAVFHADNQSQIKTAANDVMRDTRAEASADVRKTGADMRAVMQQRIAEDSVQSPPLNQAQKMPGPKEVQELFGLPEKDAHGKKIQYAQKDLDERKSGIYFGLPARDKLGKEIEYPEN